MNNFINCNKTQKMKVLNTLILILIGITCSFGQVHIKKTSTSSTGSILEFNDKVSDATNGVNNGIILPTLDTPNAAISQGAIWVDASTNKVVLNNGGASLVELTNASTTNLSSSSSTESGDGVVISDGTITPQTTDPAILKLDSNSKAMILPRVNNVVSDITNPVAGMMAYDISSKSLAVYNGDTWHFWN